MASFVENYSVELRMHWSEQSSDIVVEDMLMEVEVVERWDGLLEDKVLVVVGLEGDKQMRMPVDTSDE